MTVEGHGEVCLRSGERLLRDAVGCMNHVAGAVRRRQRELRVGKDWIGRVNGQRKANGVAIRVRT